MKEGPRIGCPPFFWSFLYSNRSNSITAGSGKSGPVAGSERTNKIVAFDR